MFLAISIFDIACTLVDHGYLVFFYIDTGYAEARLGRSDCEWNTDITQADNTHFRGLRPYLIQQDSGISVQRVLCFPARSTVLRILATGSSMLIRSCFPLLDWLSNASGSVSIL